MENTLDKRKARFEAEVDAAAEQKILEEKERLQREKYEFIETAKEYLKQEEKKLREEYEIEKAKKEIEERERTEKIKAVAPKIIVFTAFIVLLIICFAYCQNSVKNENKALETQMGAYEAQIEKYRETEYYVCMENTQVELEDGKTEWISKGSLVVRKSISNNDSKIVTKTGKEYIINGAVFILNFQRVKPFDFSEID